MTEPSRAVFLRYASQDIEPARRVCDALRAAGIEVWFDESELRGGDAWDAAIRRQVRDCALFMALISANTNARSEGYFRREWNLAVQRMLDMADDQPFLLPVLIDDTSEPAARAPDRFRERQWTRLPGGVVAAGFVERVARLLAGGLALPVATPVLRNYPITPTRAPTAIRDANRPAPIRTSMTPRRLSGAAPTTVRPRYRLGGWQGCA